MPFQETMTFEEVDAILRYDADTGKLWWKRKTASKVLVGMEAGTNKNTRAGKDGNPRPYRYVAVLGKSMPAARVAWLLHHGEWPIGKVTFKDRDQLNLRAENLSMSNSLLHSYDHENDGERADYMREHRETFPQDWKDSHLRSKFGITLSEYAELAAEQGNRCAICKRPETETRLGRVKALSVDHDHATGKVRALLCVHCNTGLGKFRDDPDLLIEASNYIKHHSGASKPVLLKEVT